MRSKGEGFFLIKDGNRSTSLPVLPTPSKLFKILFFPSFFLSLSLEGIFWELSNFGAEGDERMFEILFPLPLSLRYLVKHGMFLKGDLKKIICLSMNTS